MTHFSIVYDTVDLETACPLCGAVVHVVPGAAMTLDGEMFVCDDCARQGDPDLWNVLLFWRSAQAWTPADRPNGRRNAGGHDRGADDGFDTDFWREALAP